MSQRELPTGIHKNGKGLRIFFRYNNKPCYEQVCKTATESDIREAVAIRNEVLTLIKSGNFTEEQYFKFFNKVKTKRTLNFKEVVELWLLQLEKDKVRGVLAKSTAYSYKKQIKKSVLFFKKKLITHITAEDLEELEIDLLQAKKPNGESYSRKYVSDCVSACGLCLEFARRKGYIRINPIADMKRTRKNFKTDKTIDNLFNHSQVNNYALVAERLNYLNMANLIRFLFHTGLRLSEVFAISWEDYNEKEAELSINKSVVSGEYKQTKTSLSTRTIILSDFATKILKKQKKLTAGLEPETIQVIRYGELLTENVRFIFRSDTTGKPYLANHSYRKQWNKILNHPDKKGPNKSLMDLRHSYATNEIIAGTELMFLAQMLGHSTINTMYKHYAKIINQRNAVNKNPINRGVISAGNIERSNK